MLTTWGTVYSSSPSLEYSTPMPDCFAPPRRKGWFEYAVLVDPRRANVKTSGYTVRPPPIAAPHRAAETEVATVGSIDGIVNIAVGEDWKNWTEGLLVDNAAPSFTPVTIVGSTK